MQRTDRLFEIINILRSANKPMTADQIAAALEVTPRTVYRYIASLQSMRIPIEGAAGVGYIMRSGYDLPPLNFDESELESIIVGLGLLTRTGDRELQDSARRVLNKIETGRVAPDSLRVSNWGIEFSEDNRMQQLRLAIRLTQKLEIEYRSLDETISKRIVLPLVLTYYLEVAVLSAWCTVRNDFRNFRVDRIDRCTPLDDYFADDARHLRTRLDATEQAPRVRQR